MGESRCNRWCVAYVAARCRTQDGAREKQCMHYRHRLLAIWVVLSFVFSLALSLALSSLHVQLLDVRSSCQTSAVQREGKRRANDFNSSPSLARGSVCGYSPASLATRAPTEFRNYSTVSSAAWTSADIVSYAHAHVVDRYLSKGKRKVIHNHQHQARSYTLRTTGLRSWLREREKSTVYINKYKLAFLIVWPSYTHTHTHTRLACIE